jgi:hypothetical protein
MHMVGNDNQTGDQTRRRTVLKGLAGTGVGLAALGAGPGSAAAGGGGDCDNPDYSTPHIDTADHFDTTWYGSVYRTDGNDATNYDIEGSGFPWGADELVLHVHGWKNDYDCGVVNVEDAQAAYAGAGYDASVSGLAWDSDYSWGNGKEIAEKNGPKLAYFLYVYNYHYPDTEIRVHGHSLGARVLAETLLQLDEWGQRNVVDTAVFMAGAVIDEAIAKGNKFGAAIENAAVEAHNYWNENDSVLNWAFQTYEWSEAIGNDGCDGTPPDNWTEHEVTGHVDGHYSENYVNPDFLSTWVIPEY